MNIYRQEVLGAIMKNKASWRDTNEEAFWGSQESPAGELIWAETWMKRKVMGKPRSKQREQLVQKS